MFDAGQVATTLRGNFDGAGFKAYDSANKRAIASATRAEAAMSAAATRGAQAHERLATSAGKAAAANEEVAKSGARLRESIPLAAMNAGSKSYDEAGKNLSKLGNVAAKGAAVGIVAVGAAAIYAAAKATTFNREMLKISTQAGGSAAEVKKLSTQVLSLAGQVPQGPQKLAEGLYHIESAGFRGAQAMEMLKASAMGAALGNASLENTTQAMIAATASQIKGVHGAADAMGQLNAIVGVGDMKMEQLAQAMATGLLPSAANAGLSLKDVGAALATVTDNATPANVTATRLRMTIALMASPSKAAAKELATIGMSSTQMAHDLRQPNGLLLAVEDLKHHLKDSGKTAEEQFGVLSKVFGGGRSSAVIQTLIAETDRLRTKYNELGKASGVDKLNKSWAQFQKSEAGAFGELKSGAEAFAITVGNVLMPTLTKVAHEAAHALDGFISSGGAAKVGSDISSVFGELGNVVGSIAPPIEAAAKALIDLGGALGLGNAGEVTALVAGFLAFRTVTFVAPILTAIGGAISAVGVAAYTAPSVAAFAGDLAAMAGPAALVAAGLVVLGGAFVALDGGLFSSASAAERNAAAMRADAQAIKSVQEATQSAVKAHTAVERAALDEKKALEAKARVEKEIRDGQLKGPAAANARKEVHLGVAESSERHAEAIKNETVQLERRAKVNSEALAKANAVQQAAAKEVAQLQAGIALTKTEEARVRKKKELVSYQENYNRAAEKTAKLEAEIRVGQESLNRVQAGASAITSANAQGVAALQSALSAAHAPKKIVTRFELEDQGAQAQLGRLASGLSQLGQKTFVAKVVTTAPTAAIGIEAFRARLAGVPAGKIIVIISNAASHAQKMRELSGAIHAVPPSKGITINTNAGQARSEIQSVQGAVDGLSGKTIAIAVQKTVTTVENIVRGVTGKHASGRRRGPGEAAIVGEGGAPEYVVDSSGRGTVVTQPTVMGLSPEDYVIPLEERFRGRALGLFAMLARDLQVPGFKAGRGRSFGSPGPKKEHHPGKHWPIPNAIPPLSLPVEDVKVKQEAAKSAQDKSKSKLKSDETHVHSLEGQLHKAKGARAAKLRSELAKAKKQQQADARQLAHDKRDLAEWTRTLHAAEAFQGQIKHVEAEANNAANAMKLAAGHDDRDAYEAAKGKRMGALAHLQKLIKQAQAQVKTGSDYALKLEGEVQSFELEAQGTQAEAFQPTKTKAEEEEERTGMTAAEVAEQKRIEAGIALAALTPDLADDKAREQDLVSFLSKVLGEVQAEPGARGGDESIIAIANALKTAQSNVASFAGGSASNENADLQAQITQGKEREEVQKRRADIAEGALGVFSGSGDIGAGGSNAVGATVNVYTLHPGDPQTLSAIGAAATAGIDYQGGRQAPRVQAGP
jgi:TP901 family phage tail tape measure protein